MSVWVLQSPFTAEEEKHLAQMEELPLPFDDLPDLSGVRNEESMRWLLEKLRPDAPPETIVRRADVYWARYGRLAAADLLVIPLSNKKIALAEVVTPYHYRVELGKDSHYATVKWMETSLAQRKLGALSLLLANPSPMQMVETVDGRKAVYLLLKRSYNRFAKWRWLLALLFAMQVTLMLVNMLKD
ncbi:MAG: hypothetical protein SFX19_05165 [Alphaproteobacteria bacterium]|nr:hypothetical protein [Alphaproteobacteria bacterium]